MTTSSGFTYSTTSPGPVQTYVNLEWTDATQPIISNFSGTWLADSDHNIDLYTGLNNQNSATSTHQYLIIHHPKVGIIKLGYFLKMYQLSGNDNSQFFPLVYGGSLSNWNSSPYHGVAKWADTGSMDDLEKAVEPYRHMGWSLFKKSEAVTGATEEIKNKFRGLGWAQYSNNTFSYQKIVNTELPNFNTSNNQSNQVLLYNTTGSQWENKDFAISNMSNTNITSISDGQILKWNSSAKYWYNTPETGGGGSSTLDGLTDTSISNPTDGQVLTWNSGGSYWESTTISVGSST